MTDARTLRETIAAHPEAVAWRWRAKGLTVWRYDPELDWLERQSLDEIEAEPLAILDAHQPAPDAVAEAHIADDNSLSSRIGELGNQIHNLGCEHQNDEALSERLAELRGMAWELASLASAQTAAAVMQMREALMPTIKANCRICGGSGYSGMSGGTGNAKTTLHHCGHGISQIPLPDTTALDALIAERVREAFEEAAKVAEQASEAATRQAAGHPLSSRQHDDWMERSYGAGQAAKAIRDARASEEGQ